MGGCRCVFRDCTVSTRHHPGMHFFHFPVKDRERFEKWVKMAGVDHILQLPIQQQKNRVICARHFAEECFMNYKKDRLVTNAIPTLKRLGAGIALDYAKTGDDELPELVTLVKSKKEHLKAPPEFKCPLEVDEQELRFEEQEEEQLKDSLEQSEIMELLEPTVTKSTSKRKQHFQVKSEKKAKILKVEIPGKCEYSLKTDAFVVAKDDSAVNVRKILNKQVLSVNEEISNGSVVIYGLEELNADYVSCPSPQNDTPAYSQSSESDKTSDIINGSKGFQKEQCEGQADTVEQLLELTTVNQELHSKISQYKKSSAELKQEHQIQMQRNDRLEAAHIELEQIHRALQAEYTALVEKHQQLGVEHGKLQQKYKTLEEQQQQVSTVSTSKEPTKTAVATTAGVMAQPPSKAQLFNGIKKYLSASMVALVRMEMFGSPERQWKPDEKRTSTDLLRLGEHVFKYFSDEWRFRLPALRQVRTWLSEAVALDEDEEDL